MSLLMRISRDRRYPANATLFFKTNVDKLLILYIMIYIQYILIAQSVTTERADD